MWVLSRQYDISSHMLQFTLWDRCTEWKFKKVWKSYSHQRQQSANLYVHEWPSSTSYIQVEQFNCRCEWYVNLTFLDEAFVPHLSLYPSLPCAVTNYLKEHWLQPHVYSRHNSNPDLHPDLIHLVRKKHIQHCKSKKTRRHKRRSAFSFSKC